MRSIISLLVVCLAVATIAADPCDLNDLTPGQNSGWVGYAKDLLTCFKTIEFNKDILTHTVTQLKYLIGFYSFTDIVKDSKSSGSEYDIKIDLAGEIDALLSQDFNSDYEFHEAVVNIFLPLNDAHTLYTFPRGYAGSILSPFAYSPKLNADGSLSFFADITDPVVPPYYSKILNIDIDQFVGQEIVSVDGKNTYDYISDFADKYVSYYKDDQVRFNAAIRRLGSLTMVPMLRFGVITPAQSTYVLKDAKGKTSSVTIPFLATSSLSRNITRAIIKRANGLPNSFGLPKPKVYTRETDPMIVQPDPEHLDRREMRRTLDAIKPSDLVINNKIKVGGSRVEIVKFLKGMLVYMILDGNIAVLKVETFSADMFSGSAYISFINKAFEDAKSRGIEKIIFDMSRNGGGIICFSYMLLASVIQEWNSYSFKYKSNVFNLYDFRLGSPVVQKILDNPAGKKQYGINYGNPKTRAPFPEESWSTPIEYERGGATSEYIQKTYFPWSCVGFNFYGKIGDFPIFKQIIALTDGTCGSACSLFLTKLQENKKAYVISYGGKYSKDLPKDHAAGMETSSFAGGNVLDYSYMVDQAAKFGARPSDMSNLKTTAYLRFNFHEMYTCPCAKIPREFQKFPADAHLDNQFGAVFDNVINSATSDNANLEALYVEAATHFANFPSGWPQELSPPWNNKTQI